MSNISDWSTTASSNNSSPPNGWPENMQLSDVNNTARQNMADVRGFAEELPWFDYGHTPTRTSNTTFTIATDVTAIYHANRRIKCTDSTTLYGTIASASYSAPNTTVTVTLDSGNLSASLSAVAVSITGVTNKSITTNMIVGLTSGITALTGDVTASGTGSVTATIANNAVTLAKLATQTANTVLANATASTAVPTAVSLSASTVLGRDASGNISALTLGGGLTATSGVLSQAGRVRISSTTYTTNTTLSTTIPADNTIPQITEGSEILSLAFTPANASSTLLIQWYVYSAADGGAGVTAAALFVDSTANALDTASSTTVSGGLINIIAGAYTVSAASTSARTYRVRIGANSGSVYPNGTGGAARLYGGTSACKLIVTEILP